MRSGRLPRGGPWFDAILCRAMEKKRKRRTRERIIETGLAPFERLAEQYLAI